MLNDYQNYVDMSTFLENGSILLKCRRRFMVFNEEGNFICEATFNNEPLEVRSSSDEDDMSELSDADAMDIIYDKKEALKFYQNKPREMINFKGDPHFI